MNFLNSVTLTFSGKLWKKTENKFRVNLWKQKTYESQKIDNLFRSPFLEAFDAGEKNESDRIDEQLDTKECKTIV